MIFENISLIVIDSDWKQENVFNKSKGSANPPQYPHEYMVKTLSSSANSGLKPLEFKVDTKILEIGAFGANNLRFFLDKGCRNVFGIEVTESLVEMCKTHVAQFTDTSTDYAIENIVQGDNLNIPFPDHCFDLIVSVNTLHYCSGDDISKALNVWKRKLKAGGRLFVETAGPLHDYVLDSSRIAVNEWIWGEKSGFRHGKKAGFFDDENHLKEMLNQHFSKVSLGRVTEKAEKLTVDF